MATNPNFLSMGNWQNAGYQPMAPMELTQPAAIPDWRTPAPVQPRMFPMAMPDAPVAQPFGSGQGAWLGAYEDMAPAMSSVNAPGGAGNWFRDSGFLGSKGADGTFTQGWGGMALGAAQGIGNLYLGMKQYGLAKETLANNKAQFERNFDAQKTTTNASLEDRQRARVASNAGAYQSVGDYMNQNGVR